MAFWAVLDADFGDEHAFRDERRQATNPFGGNKVCDLCL